MVLFPVKNQCFQIKILKKGMILQKLIYGEKKIFEDKFFGLMRLKLMCLDLMEEFMLEEKGLIDI
ncbi:hypothetical protein HERIO_2613 [Hepatospora eriocheir]|uniref:Uncharacterized protein n=1 Tax=Hepatospora eriocheir TaxID=1081669 RepID=A0A1X0Q696_9MICR|nr:hypothetical protein HERIO_2613 [Hepatospora eriocheir]